MKKRLMAVFGAALILTVVSVTGVALAGNGPEAAPGGEPPTTQGPFRSDDGIDPNKCNIVHNVDACHPDGEPKTGGEPPTTQPPLRSDDGIDPDKCNRIHNINACFPDGEPNTGVATGEPGVAIGEPYPAPGANGPKGPAQCGPGQITVPVTSDGQRYCVTLEDAPSVTDPGPVSRSHQR